MEGYGPRRLALRNRLCDADPAEILPSAPASLRITMSATLTANWSYPTRVLVGPGRLAEIGEACKSAGMARPLLVTDKGLAEGAVIAKAQAALAAAGFQPAIFSDVRGNPTETNVKAGLAAFRSGPQ